MIAVSEAAAVGGVLTIVVFVFAGWVLVMGRVDRRREAREERERKAAWGYGGDR